MFARICLILGLIGTLSSVFWVSQGGGDFAFAVLVYLALAGYGGYRIYRRRYF